MSNDNEDVLSLSLQLVESELRRDAAEKLLRDSEDRFSKVIQGIDEYFYVLDRFFRFVFASRSAMAAWNKNDEHIIGAVFLDAFPQAAGSYSYETHCRVMQTRLAERFETISPVLNRWIEIHIAPTQDGGLSVGFRDIDDRKRAHEALRKSEAKYRTLFESIHEGFAIMEAVRDGKGVVFDFRVIETNRAYEAQSGLKKALGKTLLELMPRFPVERLAAYRHVLETGEPYLSEHYLPDTGRWYHNNLSRIGGSGSELVGSVFEDITERKQAEQAFVQSVSSKQK